MSPFLLLAILSLILIIPAVFVFLAKKNTPTATIPLDTPATLPPPADINFQTLPSLFQQIITDIEHLYAQIEQKYQQNSISPES